MFNFTQFVERYMHLNKRSVKEVQDRMKLILDSYDIKHLSKRCNFNGCENKPTKLIEIVERNNVKKKTIAKIYLCNEHIHTIDELIEKLKKISKGVIIEKIVKGL